MPGGSILTRELEPLGHKSKVIRNMINELYALDDALQVAHQQAKRDDDFGEEVVTKYKAFLSCRQQLIAEMEKQKIQVPWQLRITIDELELTLTQREEKKSTSFKECNTPPTEAIQAPVQAAQSGRVTAAFVGPALVVLMIAIVSYHFLHA